MMKFVAVLHRRADLSMAAFEAYTRQVHGPMAQRLPGLRRYVQNFPRRTASRPEPDWSAIIELLWSDAAAMEAAWISAEGVAATADLANFADLQRTSWSAVEVATPPPAA